MVESIARAVGADANHAREAAGYLPEKAKIPDFLFDIDFAIFDENDLAQIENFIRFLANQKGERYIIHRTHTHGTIKADDKAA